MADSGTRRTRVDRLLNACRIELESNLNRSRIVFVSTALVMKPLCSSPLSRKTPEPICTTTAAYMYFKAAWSWNNLLKLYFHRLRSTTWRHPASISQYSSGENGVVKRLSGRAGQAMLCDWQETESTFNALFCSPLELLCTPSSHC